MEISEIDIIIHIEKLTYMTILTISYDIYVTGKMECVLPLLTRLKNSQVSFLLFQHLISNAK